MLSGRIRLVRANSTKGLVVYRAFGIVDHDCQIFFTYQKTSDTQRVSVVLKLSSHTAKPYVEIPGDTKLLALPNQSTDDQYEPWEGRVYIINA